MVCLKCCFWCLEKFIKFLNRNAYIMVNNRAVLLPWVGGFPISIPRASNLLLFTPDCYLWHQLLHLSQECLLPPYEKYHQVRGDTPPASSLPVPSHPSQDPSCPSPLSQPDFHLLCLPSGIHLLPGSEPMVTPLPSLSPTGWLSWTKLQTSSSCWANF